MSALDEFAIKVGIKLDDDEAVAKAKFLANELITVFNDKLAVNGDELIDVTNEEKSIKQLTELVDKLGSGFRATFKDDGSQSLSTFSLNLENAHKGITTIQIDLKKVNEQLSQLKAGELSGEGGAEQEELSIEDRLKKYGSVSVTDKTNPDYQISELIEKYQRLEDLQLKLAKTPIDTATWEDLAGKVDKAEKSLNSFLNKHIETIDIDKAAATELKYNIDLQNKLSEIQARQTDKKNQETETANQKGLEQSLKAQITYQTKINDLNNKGRTEEANAYQQILNNEKQKASYYASNIKDQTALNNLAKQYAQNMSVVSGKQKDTEKATAIQEDTKKIQQVIKLYNELTEAKIKMYKLQEGNASDEVLTLNRKHVDELQKSYANASSAVLSNNKAVTENEKVIENATNRDRELVEAQNNVVQGLKNSTVHVNSFSMKFNDMIKNVFQYKLLADVYQLGDNAIMNSVKKMKDLDDEMTQIRLVTGQTSAEAHQMIGEYADLAVQLNTTTQAVAEGSIEWLRQGKSVEETSKLLKASTVLSKVGMMDSASATEKLTAALNGFKLGANDAMGIVDKLSALDLKYATSADEIATALQYVASNADLAGISLDKMSSLITVASSTTRLSAETIGTAFKSIITRMQNVKAGKFVDDETGENLNDVEAVLKKLGIQLRDSQTSWRSFGDVIDEVGKKWDSFNDIQKSAISTAVAGSRQANIFTATMANYNKVLEANNVAATSAGTAQEKYKAIADSIDGKLNSLISTWDKFINNLNQSGTIKNIVDLGTQVLNILDNLLLKNNLLSSAIILIVGQIAKLGIEKVVSGITSVTGATEGYIMTLGKLAQAEMVKDANTETSYIKYQGETLALGSLNQAQLQKVLIDNKESLGIQQLDAVQLKNLLTRQGVSEKIAADTALKVTNTIATEANTVATEAGAVAGTASIGVFNALKLAVSGLTTAFEANPIGVGITLITTALTFLVPLIQDLSQAQQKAIDTSNQLLDSFKQQKSTLDDNANSVKSIEKEYAQLKQGVNGLNQNVSLSSEQYNKFLTLNKQIAGIAPDLVSGYDAQGNAILNLNGNVSQITDSLNKMLEAEKLTYNQDIIKKSDDIWGGIKSEIAETKDNLHDIQELKKLLASKQTFNDFEFDNLSKELDNLGVKYKATVKIINGEPMNAFDFGNVDINSILSKFDKETNEIKNKLQDSFSKIQPVIQAKIAVNPDYLKMTPELQNMINKVFSGLDLSKAGSNPDEIYDFVTKNIINPIYKSSPQIEKAIQSVLNLQNLNKSGKLGNSDFKAQVSKLFTDAFKDLDVTTKDLLSDAFDKAGVSGNTLSKQLTNLFTTSNEATQGLIDTAQAAQDFSNTVSGIIDRYTDLNNIILDTNTHNALSSDNLKKIIKDYSDLTPLVMQYSAGLKTSTDVINALKSKQNEQMELYKQQIVQQLSSDVNFYKEKISKNTDLVKQLKDNYNIDYNNYTSFSALKNAVEDSVMAYRLNNAGKTGATLADAYLSDATNYGSFETGKIGITNAVKNSIESMNDTKVKELAAKYGVDVSNYSGNEEAKAKITAEVTTKITQMYAASNSSFASMLQTELKVAQANMNALADKAKKDPHAGELYGQAQEEVASLQEALKGLDPTNAINGVEAKIKSILGSIKANLPDTNKEISSAEAAAKKAASEAKKDAKDAKTALKDQYDAKLKLIEANEADNKYAKYTLEYYRALTGLQKEFANTALDTDTKLELQKKITSALKDYQQDILDLSMKQVEDRIKEGKVEENSVAVLQNYKEILANLKSGRLYLVDTAEKELELQQKIYDVSKAILENEKQQLDDQVGLMQIEENSAEYLNGLYKIKQDILKSDLNTVDKQKELLSINKDIISAEKSYIQNELEKEQKAIENRIKGYEKEQKAIEKKYQTQIDADEKQLKALQKQEDALENLYQPQLDAIEAQTKALEKQEKVVENLYQPQIDALQEIIDQKNAANDATNKAIELEKAQEALLTAQNQKNNRIYKQGQGFVWEADKSAISDAKKNLDDLNYQKEIDDLTAQKDKLQKALDAEKKSLETQMDTLNDYKETLQDTWDAEKKVLEEQIKALNNHKDELQDAMDSEKATIQVQIDYLNDYKDKWDELLDYYQDNTMQFIKTMTNGNTTEVGLLQTRLKNYIKNNTDFLDLFTTSNETENDLLTVREGYYTDDNEKSVEAYQQRVKDLINNQKTYLTQLQTGNTQENQALLTRLSNLDSFRAKYASIQSQINAVNNSAISSINNVSDKYNSAASSISNYMYQLQELASMKSEQNSIGYAKVHGAFAEGGVDTKGGLNMLHGTEQKPEMILNNNDVKKVYDVIHNTDNLSSYVVNQMAQHTSKITTNNKDENKVDIKIGDIIVQGVKDADGLAQTVVEKLPAAMIQKIFKKGA